MMIDLVTGILQLLNNAKDSVLVFLFLSLLYVYPMYMLWRVDHTLELLIAKIDCGRRIHIGVEDISYAYK